MKKFLKMSFIEKIAYLNGYSVYDETEIATWSDEDREYYYYCIKGQTGALATLVLTIICTLAVIATMILVYVPFIPS